MKNQLDTQPVEKKMSWYTPVSYTHLDVYKRQVCILCGVLPYTLYIPDF